MDDAWNIFSKSSEACAAGGGGACGHDEMPSITVKTTHRKLSEPYCNECGSYDLVSYEGHQICSCCGTDLGPILEGDDGSMYHDTAKSGNTHRLSGGMNSLLQKSSLGTSIGHGSYKFRHLMRYHNYNSMPYKERS
jgi:transcription initiation factor TFIIB